MPDKITLASIASFQNDTTAAAAYNSNNALITTAMDNTLSRDGTSPNQMLNNLDMNNNQILNLPAPATVNSPARLVDVASNPTITVPSVGTSGANVGLLNANKTDSGNNTFTGTETFSNTVTFNGTVNLNSTTNLPANSVGSSQIAANAVTNADFRQGIARSVVGVTGNATANVADIQGTTRQILAVNTAGTAVAFAQPQGDQLLGTTTNDSASVGNVGEYVESVIPAGAAITLTTVTNANLTSISLTAGDWDVDCGSSFVGSGTTTILGYTTSLSTTSLTLDQTVGRSVTTGQAGQAPTTGNGYPGNTITQSLGPRRFSLGSTTTIYAVVQASFATSTLTAYGILRARRIR
jgi:hypothetical protein